jgi:hypothetical protein
MFFSLFFGRVRSMELQGKLMCNQIKRDGDGYDMGYSSNSESAAALAVIPFSQSSVFHSPFSISGIRAYAYAYRISDVNTPDRNLLHLHTHILIQYTLNHTHAHAHTLIQKSEFGDTLRGSDFP